MRLWNQEVSTVLCFKPTEFLYFWVSTERRFSSYQDEFLRIKNQFFLWHMLECLGYYSRNNRILHRKHKPTNDNGIFNNHFSIAQMNGVNDDYWNPYIQSIRCYKSGRCVKWIFGTKLQFVWYLFGFYRFRISMKLDKNNHHEHKNHPWRLPPVYYTRRT